MEWFRWHHGAVSDRKWPLVARRCGQSVGVVVSVWAALLEHASQAEERGSVRDFNCEEIDVLYGYADGTTETVCNAMKRTDCFIIENDKISSWNKRQPLREDRSTDRVRAHRDRVKTPSVHGVCINETQCNADETQCNGRSEQIRPEHTLKNKRESPQPDLHDISGKSAKDPKPNPCPPETWARYLRISHGFHTDKAEQLGARAPYTEAKVVDGARVLDKLIRIDGRPEDEVIALLGWSTENEFWRDQIRTIKGLLRVSKNGDTKYANALTSMERDIERRVSGAGNG